MWGLDYEDTLRQSWMVGKPEKGVGSRELEGL